MNRDASSCCRGANAFEIVPIVALVKETWLAVDPVRNHMLPDISSRSAIV